MRGVRRDRHDVNHFDVRCKQMFVLRCSLACLRLGRASRDQRQHSTSGPIEEAQVNHINSLSLCLMLAGSGKGKKVEGNQLPKVRNIFLGAQKSKIFSQLPTSMEQCRDIYHRYHVPEVHLRVQHTSFRLKTDSLGDSLSTELS